MKKLLSLGVLTLMSAAQAETTANFIAKMLANPEKTGAYCIKASSGKSCAWEKNIYFESAEMAFRSKTFYTLIISDPKFKLEDLGIMNPRAKVSYMIKSGPLAGNYISQIPTNQGSQLNLRSVSSYKKFGI